MDRLVLPFIHIQERGDEKSANLAKRVELAQLTENESRVVMQFNQNINFDPSASFNLKTQMNHYYAMYVTNLLMGMAGGLFGPSSKLYVTHNLKQIPGLHIIDNRTIRVLEDVLLIYLEDTMQEPTDFAIGAVLDTSDTVHTMYCRAEVVPADAPFADIHLLDGYEIPWSLDFMSGLVLHYPIEIVVADMSISMISTGDGMYDVGLSARVAGTENKRAVL